jgi:hypothetical protein
MKKGGVHSITTESPIVSSARSLRNDDLLQPARRLAYDIDLRPVDLIRRQKDRRQHYSARDRHRLNAVPPAGVGVDAEGVAEAFVGVRNETTRRLASKRI